MSTLHNMNDGLDAERDRNPCKLKGMTSSNPILLLGTRELMSTKKKIHVKMQAFIFLDQQPFFIEICDNKTKPGGKGFSTPYDGIGIS